VTSAVVRLTMRPGDAPDARFIEFLQRCFRQRRKTLRNNLSGMYSDAALAAAEANRLRAEQLGVDELRALWIRLESV
jgi:16S rRNA A1518/A1519 N6-dimethyltransferase RsmA/KsgA/DIM1 with predicted DNA glycosylase/AP lyase activity